MDIVIEEGSPLAPGARALLEESHALMTRLYPPEQNHALAPEALASADTTFFVASRGGAALGCVAVKRHADCAELKSFFVRADARGAGLGARLLARAEDAARAEGFAVMRLETGDALAAATALYVRSGYVRCGPFAAYYESPGSVFYEKRLPSG